MKGFKSVLFGFVLAGLLSACGNAYPTPDRFGTLGQGYTSDQPDSYMSTELQCSETPNIVSASGESSREYRGCRNQSSASKIRLYPENGALQTVCVFPLNAGRGIVSNPYGTIYTRYAVQCANLASSGAEFDFGGLSFDSVHVVRAADASLMSYCLAYGNVAACASQSALKYSSGSL
jgi:hypothetical protein